MYSTFLTVTFAYFLWFPLSSVFIFAYFLPNFHSVLVQCWKFPKVCLKVVMKDFTPFSIKICWSWLKKISIVWNAPEWQISLSFLCSPWRPLSCMRNCVCMMVCLPPRFATFLVARIPGYWRIRRPAPSYARVLSPPVHCNYMRELYYLDGCQCWYAKYHTLRIFDGYIIWIGWIRDRS